MCAFPKYICLYNYCMAIKLRKLNTDVHLIHSPYSNLTKCSLQLPLPAKVIQDAPLHLAVMTRVFILE